MPSLLTKKLTPSWNKTLSTRLLFAVRKAVCLTVYLNHTTAKYPSLNRSLKTVRLSPSSITLHTLKSTGAVTVFGSTSEKMLSIFLCPSRSQTTHTSITPSSTQRSMLASLWLSRIISSTTCNGLAISQHQT